MKQTNLIKIVVVFIILVTWSIDIFAQQNYDFVVDGIYYKEMWDPAEGYYVCVRCKEYWNGTGNYDSDYTGDIVIPNRVTHDGNTYPVKGIDSHAFYNCTSLTSVTIPNSITYISDYAFYKCNALTTIDIPNSVVNIGSQAFRYCSGLTHVTIPRSVRTIRNYAFSDTNLKFAIVLRPTPIDFNYDIFPRHQLVFVPDVSLYENYSLWNHYNLQYFAIEPQLTKVNVSSNELLTLKQADLKDVDGQAINSIIAQNNSYLTITDLMPGSAYNVDVTVDYNGEDYVIDDSFVTNMFSFKYKYNIGPSQTMYKVAYSVDRDDNYEFEAYGLNVRKGYTGDYLPYDDCGRIIETTNDSITIEYTLSNLTPNTIYYYTPWVQYKGKNYSPFMGGNYFTTKQIDTNYETVTTPTSVYLAGEYSAGDAVVTDAYFTFNDEKYKTLYLTGLNPNTSYNYTYTIETISGSQVNNQSFITSSLSMVAQPVKMLTNTTVMFEAQTNMIDEETMVGFEWRRYDAPDEMPSTKVYSPVFGGKIAGTLKNLAENVYYKYRPFYTSNSGKSYYGNWVAFLTADAGVVYEPIVYTYNSPAVTQTEATLQGVALRGSDDITEQGFEYWKSGNANVTKVTATGERMSKKVSGLQSGSKYIFRAFLTAGGETHYGNEVEFVTLSNSLDVNIDGEINIADINAVIDMILTDNQVSSGDVNGDGEVNIADINTIIDAILSNYS